MEVVNKKKKDLLFCFRWNFSCRTQRVVLSSQNKISADQYHVTISGAQVKSSSRSCVFWKLTADQALVFNWITGTSQVITLLREGGSTCVFLLLFHNIPCIIVSSKVQTVLFREGGTSGPSFSKKKKHSVRPLPWIRYKLCTRGRFF